MQVGYRFTHTPRHERSLIITSNSCLSESRNGEYSGQPIAYIPQTLALHGGIRIECGCSAPFELLFGSRAELTDTAGRQLFNHLGYYASG
jgi:hypothetical protein